MKKTLTSTFLSLLGGVLLTAPASAAGPDLTGAATNSTVRPPRITSGPQRHPDANPFTITTPDRLSNDPLSAAFTANRSAGPSLLSALPGQVNLTGIVLYSIDYITEGLCRIPQNASHSFHTLNDQIYCTTGAIRQGDTYYLVQAIQGSWRMDKYDPETWELLSRDWDDDGSKYGHLTAQALASDPATGRIYGCFDSVNGDSYEFGYADYANLTRTTICTLPNWWRACGIDSQGRLFAIDGSSDVYIVDKETGDMTFIGNTGVEAYWQAGGTIDPDTDTFYYTTSTSAGGFLYSVNLTNGAATKLYQFPANEEVAFLYMETPLAPATAPAAATDLAVDFSEGVEGTVSFTIPAHLYNGEDAEGDVSFTILANNDTIMEGTAAYGASVNVQVTLPSSGKFEIAVIISNENGSSPTVKTSVSVGNSAPLMGAVTLSYDGSVMSLEWPKAKAADPEATFDIEKVTYTVVRQPDGVTVASDIKENSFQEEYIYDGELKSVSYEVTAYHVDTQSEPKASNSIFIGYILPPFNENFDDPYTFAMFKTIDGNGDGRIWQHSSGTAKMVFNVYIDMDDWMVTPAIKLEKGKYYKFSLDVRCEKETYPERFEVCWGTAPEADALVNTLIPASVVNYTSFTNHYDYIVPEADGLYYIGIHGISERDEYNLYVDNLSLEDGLPETTPGLVTDLSVIPDFNGNGEAKITFTAPSVDLGAAPLASLDCIEVFRGDSLITSITPAVPGQTYTVTDTDIPAGVITYSVVGVNADGRGVPVRCETRIGIPAPTAPTAITVAESSPGQVTVSWNAPETDTYGNPLNQQFVTYTVTNADNGNVWASGLTEPTASFTALTSGQKFMRFTVTASTETGTAAATTLLTPVGEPYALPYLESFADALPSYTLGTIGDGGKWELYKDSEEMKSADNDNGFIAMYGPVIENNASIWTGKIDLTRAANPVISLQVFNFHSANGDDENINTVELLVKTFGEGVSEYETILTKKVCELGDLGWNTMTADLSAYKGKVISIRIFATTESHSFTFIDDIRIFDDLAYNIATDKLIAPAEVLPGREFEVSFNVTNTGSQPAESWTASLSTEGFGTMVSEGKALAPGESCTVTFAVTLNSSSRTENLLSASVEMDSDENAADDIASAVVSVYQKALQAPAGLTGEYNNSTASLSWSQPEMTEIIREETESFEWADAWTDDVEGWSFVDLDEGMVGGFKQTEIPCLPAGTYGAFWVMDSKFEGFNATFASHTGTHYLGGMYNIFGEANDDWAISPELEGGAQTISIFARSYTNAESIQILYSTGSTDPEDFIALIETTEVPSTWTCFEVELPEGALRFAIRSVGIANLMLMLDDFTFTPRPAMRDAVLIGYNVYRDGVKLNDAPVEETAYTDNMPGIQAEYTVTAVYNNGESGPSEHVVVKQLSGIEGISGNTADVTVAGHTIFVNGAAGKPVSVTAVDGRTVYSSAAADRHAVEVSAGLYIVTLGDNSVKVTIR